MQPADVVACWNTKLNPVSGLIEFISNGPSHVAIVRQPAIEGYDVMLSECTLSAKTNGVCTTPLSQLLAEYGKGTKVSWFALTSEARKRLDLFEFYKCIGAHDGVTHYSIRELLEFLLPDWLDERIIPKASMVCSVWVATVLKNAKITPDIQAWRMSPANVIELPIFKKEVRIK